MKLSHKEQTIQELAELFARKRAYYTKRGVVFTKRSNSATKPHHKQTWME